MTARSPGPAPVLVVDDDAGTRELVALALRRAGLEVLEVSGGQAALDILATATVSLVVLDIGMPGMSGTEVVEALRARPETVTLPVLLMTGSGDEFSVISGLAAGADDFLPKPVRLDELVARVNAHLRRQVAWSRVLEERMAQLMRERAVISETLRGLQTGDTPEATAQAVCRQVLNLTGVAAAELLIFGLDGRAVPIGFTAEGVVDPPLRTLPYERSQQVRDRAAEGPWIESWVDRPGHPYNELLAGFGAHLVACAPMRSDGALIGLLVVDAAESVDEATLSESLGALVEFANLAAALIGREVAQRTEAREAREHILGIIAAGAFQPVFQPIVDLESEAVVGYEALTRFADGIGPDLRFGEAAMVGLGTELELVTLQAVLAAADALPRAPWLSLNVSPGLIVAGQPLRDLVLSSSRRVVLEVTEHAAISDYVEFRTAVADLGPRTLLAVDDAGAGFASLRHILELRPAFVKLDRSLILGLESDEARQAMIVGLGHFTRSTGCRLIAEGIETDGELKILRTLGIPLGQGYILGRPIPAPY